MPVNHPWGLRHWQSFAAVPIALVNETVGMTVAVCVDPVAAAAANILSLQTGLLHPPNTDCMIVARRCEHVWICRIPAYAVDSAGVARQSLN
jgi:hypothetical protein